MKIPHEGARPTSSVTWGRMLPVSLLLFNSCGEVRDAHYGTLEAARAADAVNQGWIPAGLPADARDIRLRWDIETNQTWLAFTTDSAASLDSLAGARLEALEPKHVHYPDFSQAKWWPKALTRGGQGDLAGSTLRLYRMIERGLSPADSPHNLYVAVDAEHSRVFVWRPAA